jgi:hypothetical protein
MHDGVVAKIGGRTEHAFAFALFQDENMAMEPLKPGQKRPPLGSAGISP